MLLKGRDYIPSMSAKFHIHIPQKRIKYDVIKRQCYELTGLGNHYIKIVNSRIIKLNLYLFLSSYARVSFDTLGVRISA